jgi:hypothetical protein
MITIDYNNARLVDVLDYNSVAWLCWVDNETGAVLREFDETDLEITSEYVEFWDAGREAVVGAWVDSTGKIAEIVDETTREAERELALDDDFLFDF